MLPRQDERRKAGAADRDDSPLTLTSFGDGEFFQLAYAEGARFVVDRTATRVWGTSAPPLTLEDAITYLLGPVMGFVLRRRGVLALHGSCARLSDSSVILCGNSGLGKSTTAAALALRGVAVLTDDISPVVEENGQLYVEPGYPRLCLWPDAVKILFGTSTALPRLTPTWEKCYLPLDGVRAQFEAKKQPLGVIYTLAPRLDEPEAPRIEELGMREAFLELIKNTYMNWLLDRHQRAGELDALARLVQIVPVRRIVPHSDPARVRTLCDMIVRDSEQFARRRAVLAAASAG